MRVARLWHGHSDVISRSTSWTRSQRSQCLSKKLEPLKLCSSLSCEDLDLFAREGLLRFLRRESEEKGAFSGQTKEIFALPASSIRGCLCKHFNLPRTIFYATHIFDHLAEWATHVLYFEKGKIECCCPLAVTRRKSGTRSQYYSWWGVSHMAAQELAEYHALVAKGTRCPLYALMILGRHLFHTKLVISN